MAVEVTRLLTDNGTLYGQKSSYIAEQVTTLLNDLSRQGYEILSVSALPDYHHFGLDGGVKDILILYDTRSREKTRKKWHVTQLVQDSDTLYGLSTQRIMEILNEALERVRLYGGIARDIVPLIDHHSFTMVQGVGGYDGAKNILIFYYVR